MSSQLVSCTDDGIGAPSGLATPTRRQSFWVSHAFRFAGLRKQRQRALHVSFEACLDIQYVLSSIFKPSLSNILAFTYLIARTQNYAELRSRNWTASAEVFRTSGQCAAERRDLQRQLQCLCFCGCGAAFSEVTVRRIFRC